jgi:G patch domain-containing protein 1
VVPVSDPIGARLLRKMGWRAGKGIGRKGAAADGADADGAGASPALPPAPPRAPRVVAAVEALPAGAETVLAGDDAEAHDDDVGDAAGDDTAPLDACAQDAAAAAAAQRLRRRRRRWGSVAGALADDVTVEIPPPKRDVHGLGFDPFAGAEEFRARKRSRADAGGGGAGGAQLAVPDKRARGGAFGVGVFEAADDDVYGGGREETHFEICAGGSDDEDEAQRFGGRLGGHGAPPRLALGAAPQRLALAATPHAAGTLRGFVAAAAVEAPPKVFPPPLIPRGWQPFHRFATPLQPPAPPPGPPPGRGGRAGPPPPPPPAPPADAELAARCDTLAVFVARNGPSFEDLARQRQRTDARFSFLFGGEGAEYYAWRCAQLRAQPAPPRPEQRSAPLSAEQRGRMLGEAPLGSSAEGAAHTAASMQQQQAPPPPPPPKGIAPGDRAALLASLGRTFTSESAPSNAAAPLPGAPQPLFGLQPGVKLADKFASGGTETAGAAAERSSAAAAASAADAPLPPPCRATEDWGPEPLLCKRFGVADPFKGRTRPGEKRTFRTDTFALPETAQAAQDAAPKFLTQAEAAAPPLQLQLLPPPPPLQLLPPPPPRPALAGAAAAALPPPPPLPPAAAVAPPADSASLADDFLASLGGPAAGSAAAAPSAAPVAMALRATEKPIDLFTAIFEADDEEEEEEEEEGDAAQEPPPLPPPPQAAAAAAGAAMQPVAAPGPFAALAALAAEHEARRRREKKEKHKHSSKEGKSKKSKSKRDKKEKRSKDKKSKSKHAAPKAARGGSASGSSSPSSSGDERAA